MTDNEIIKALNGSILNAKRIDCKAWSLEVYKLENALDLINRQKAEIEQWKEEANRYQNLWCIATDDIFKAKSEAIKEFVEKLKERANRKFFETLDYVSTIEIDDLVEEMLGE